MIVVLIAALVGFVIYIICTCKNTKTSFIQPGNKLYMELLVCEIKEALLGKLSKVKLRIIVIFV